MFTLPHKCLMDSFYQTRGTSYMLDTISCISQRIQGSHGRFKVGRHKQNWLDTKFRFKDSHIPKDSTLTTVTLE